MKHNCYAGTQLDAALTIIDDHPEQVGPIFSDIGADDFHGDTYKLNTETFNKHLAALDQRLTGVILPKLLAAIADSHGQRTTDPVMMNYYDPYENKRPNVHPYFIQIDDPTRCGGPKERERRYARPASISLMTRRRV